MVGAMIVFAGRPARGKNADAKAVAGKVITDQTAEIATMQQLLAK
jgi:uncharacterized protein (DUF305 family)